MHTSKYVFVLGLIFFRLGIIFLVVKHSRVNRIQYSNVTD